MRNGRAINANPGKHLVSFLMVLLILTIGIGIGTLISYRVGAVGPGDSQLKIQTDGKPIVGGAALSLSQAFEEVAKRVEPAVVNINTEEVVKLTQRRSQNRRGQQQPPQQQNPRQRDPMDDLLNRLPFFGTPELPDQYTRKSLGSGVIVDPKGYIITNNHVVEGASKIKVTIEEQEYTAHVIAADQLSDIAVIKIEGTKEFAYARIGDAKGMKVGDWVLAIGSPFGLEQTVTAGIVSATGRVFPDAQQTGSMAMMFNDYLQTDAAINPGNSGGPLVNLNGEVVGINTFISTTTRSSAGVGFAVPSHIFVNVYNQILEKGKVTRGWLGVNMNYGMPWTPAMAKFFGVKQGRGVLITGLSEESGKPSENGPAARAGMKAEDVVVEFDGKKISTVQDLRLAVASTPPGRKVRVKVVRHGVEKDLEVGVGERKLEDQDARAGRGGFSFEEREEEPKPEIGLEFDDVPPQTVSELKIPGGALINSVRVGSLAEEASLEEGNIVVAANGKPILAARDLFNIIRDLKKGEAAVLKFLRVQRDERGGVNSATFYTSISKP
jgi:serine protease Do